MKLYISGRITGMPEGEAQRIFNSGKLVLNNSGYQVLDPHDIGACPDESCEGLFTSFYLHAWECYLKYDLVEMILCDGVAMLYGWEESKGATLEFNTAKALAIPVHTIDWWIQNANLSNMSPVRPA